MAELSGCASDRAQNIRFGAARASRLRGRVAAHSGCRSGLAAAASGFRPGISTLSSGILPGMRFRTVVQSSGRTGAFLPVPPKSTEALGGGKTPAVTVTLNGHTYQANVDNADDGLGVPVNAVERQAAGIEVGDEVDVEMKLAGLPPAV